MKKDLTTSKIHRENILNNEMAIYEIQENSNISAVLFKGKYMFTKEMVSKFFDVDIRTIERYLNTYSKELKNNGYQVLRGANLKNFLKAHKEHFGTDIDVGSKITVLGVFEFKAFLNLAMLLSESSNAKILRQAMLDIVIDLINEKTGGSTKYINQRDKSFVGSYLQGENYRLQFTDSLKDYVNMGPIKYAIFTDMIYQSIFKENAKEYKEILRLQNKDRVRDTFYTEILDLIAAYEYGLADTIKKTSKSKNRKLTNWEMLEIFKEFEDITLLKPLINSARNKMASRDLALRDAFHKQLEEYLSPLSPKEYELFLGDSGKELDRLMEENKDVLKRLKDRE